MKYLAYAKINLRLEVEKKLENGYHLLHMLNAKVSLADELEINESNSNQITFSCDNLNKLENNICLNVLNEICNLYHIKKRFNIYIKKNIPQGAGLGGGSSDVAAIINFLDEYCNLNLSLDKKIQIGLKYGADVPYCLINDLAYVSGIGEKITTINTKFDSRIVIIYPDLFVSTKDVFKNVKKYSSPLNLQKLKELVLEKDFNSLLYNDLEDAAFTIYPSLKEIKTDLQNFGQVVMSGSGSTMLLIPNKRFDIEQLKDKYPTFKIFDSYII